MDRGGVRFFPDEYAGHADQPDVVGRGQYPTRRPACWREDRRDQAFGSTVLLSRLQVVLIGGILAVLVWLDPDAVVAGCRVLVHEERDRRALDGFPIAPDRPSTVTDIASDGTEQTRSTR